MKQLKLITNDLMKKSKKLLAHFIHAEMAEK
jgi:hypothetical protein